MMMRFTGVSGPHDSCFSFLHGCTESAFICHGLKALISTLTKLSQNNRDGD